MSPKKIKTLIKKRRPIKQLEVRNDSTSSSFEENEACGNEKDSEQEFTSSTSVSKVSNSSIEEDPNKSSKDTSKTDVPEHPNSSQKSCQLLLKLLQYLWVPAVILSFTAAWVAVPDQIAHCALNDMKNEFPTQSNEFWLSLKSGVDDVKNFSRPSVFLYLYKDSTEQHIDHLINKISAYAICELKQTNDIKPLELTEAELNTRYVKQDYGLLIERYRFELESKAVMIVKHLDQVPSKVAEAFHTFCDEINPLVRESLFLFTMKVDDYQKSDFLLAERILREKWSDLDEDVFDPLYTRLSSMIIRINP